MEDAVVVRYWCHLCSLVVHPIMDAEIKCPFCQNGFVEEMTGGTPSSDRRLSLLTPSLLSTANNNPRPLRRNGTMDFGDSNENSVPGTSRLRLDDLDQELEDVLRRRRRSSATIRRLLQSQPQHRVQSRIEFESENGVTERVILINPLEQTISVQGSLGDYLVGPGLELLLRHLTENETSQLDGTPPARKEAMEALPDVKIKEISQCSVCLDDFKVGTEVKEMPCKHKFHGKCILPWLELHGSCPVCRYELRADETKAEQERPRTSNDSHEGGGGGGGRSGNGRRISLPWPLRGLFSSSRNLRNPS